MFRRYHQLGLLTRALRLTLALPVIVGLAAVFTCAVNQARPARVECQPLDVYQPPAALQPAAPAANCVQPPVGLVSWWSLDGNANDLQLANNAGLTGNPAFVNGVVAQALSFDGLDDYAKVFASPSLDVGAGNGFTLSLWINPADVSVQRPLAEWNDSFGDVGVHFWIAAPFAGGGSGSLFANMVDTVGEPHLISSAPGVLIANTYQHVAITYDKSDGVHGYATLYVNGNVVAGPTDLGLFNPETRYDLFFGLRPSGGFSGTRFIGQMDEIELFNRALSTAEIQAIQSGVGCNTRYVTNTNDSGAGSLRQALNDSNSYPGPDRIYFNIPGGGVKTISPLSALPNITGPVTIDGTTQPGFAGAPIIELNGAVAGEGAYGLFCYAPVTIKGLVINRFSFGGILLSRGSNGSIIAGNYIGTNAAGNAPLGNDHGIFVEGGSSAITIGGTTTTARNILSGNRFNGVYIFIARNTLVQGNFIGTDVTGALDLGNGWDGIAFASTIDNGNSTIGGLVAGARNVISGNGRYGIAFSASSSGNVVQGNYIGTDATGTQQIGNSAAGIGISSSGNQIGGTTPAARNVISGNFQQGIQIYGLDGGAPGNIIQGNYIGTNAAGTAALGNEQGGVLIYDNANNNTVGGAAAGAGNLIAFNGGVGLKVAGANSVRNVIQGNSIFSNSGLGIDLSPAEGVTANDANDPDSGANNLQNFPVPTSALAAGGNTTIQGTLNSAPGQGFHLELFANSACDPSGHGEGQTFLGFTNANTNGSGNASFSLTVPTAAITGPYLTATATDLNGNTSEFSPCFSTCIAQLSPASASFPGSAGTGTPALTGAVNVSLPAGCNWTANSNAGFIFITGGSGGSGNGTVTYALESNSSSTRRSGSLTLGNQTFTVLQGPQFLDVPSAHAFYTFIGKLAARGVTLGCGGGNYCPEANVTREQMAAFIIRALGEFNPPTPALQRFADVPPSHPFYAFIEELALRGITLGCGGGNYCPAQAVTREQMAAFLIRALGVFNPPTPTSQRFADVPPSNPFYAFIEELAARGITLGCGGGNYCPTQAVTRGQMAAFLVRAFNL